MTWHTLAFGKLDTAAATLEQIPAVQDQIVTRSANNNYLLQQAMQLQWAYARDNGATRARINMPSYRRISIPHIHPKQRQLGVTTLPSMERFRNTRMILPALEELIFEMSNDGAGGVAAVGGLWITPPGQTLNVAQGDMYKLHATATTVAPAAFTWQIQAITLDEILPVGTYDIVGMDVISRGAVGVAEFARLVFTGGADVGKGQLWRPGVLIQAGEGNKNWDWWQNGAAGTFGSFASTTPPQVEIFSVTAVAATYDLYIDIIRRT